MYSYYISFTQLLANPLASIAIGLLFAAYIAITYYGAHGKGGDPHASLIWPIFLLIILGCIEGNDYLAYPYGHVYRTGDDIVSVVIAQLFYFALTFVYVPLFIFCHVIVSWGIVRTFPAFIRGAHFLFVPHPASRHVSPALQSNDAGAVDLPGLADTLKRTMHEMAPRFIHENMLRKAEKLTENLRAKEKRLHEEIKLAEAALDHERARAARRDAPR
jgi:hypothetical protein